MTAESIINDLEEALKEFGTHAYDDKGPSEVVDIPAIVSDLNSQPAAAAIAVLEAVCKHKDKEKDDSRSLVLVNYILNEMAEKTDEVRWEAMMQSRVLFEAFED